MLNIELSDLTFLQAVAKHGGITHAARQLHCVPSNVSTRIKQLELKLGVSLFIREAKTMRLSSQGRTLLEYAKRITTLVGEAHQSMVSSEPQGVLRLGSMDSLAATRLPTTLAAYHKRYPKVTIELTLGSTSRLRKQVLDGELEAAVIGDPGKDERLLKQPFTEEQLIIVAPAGTPVVRKPADVAGRSLVAFPAGCAIRERMEAWFMHGAGSLPRTIELTSYHAILGCVAAGMGIAAMPQIVLDGFVNHAGVTLHQIGSRWSKMPTAIVWRDGADSPRLTAFRQLMAHRRAV